MKTVSLKDVAEAAGVSPATASRALNNRDRVMPELRTRIIETARRLGYIARAGSRSRVIAVLMPPKRGGCFSPYTSDLLNALLEEESIRRDYRIMILSVDDLALLEEYLVAGIISIAYQERYAGKVPQIKNLPMVCINDYDCPMENVHSVCSDERQGIGLALDRLHALGHKRIGFLCHHDPSRPTAEQNLIARLRLRSYLEWMTAAGLGEYTETPLLTPERPIHEAVARLLQKEATAILTTGESAGMHLYHTLELFGRRIPYDISVVSWETTGVSVNQTPRATTLKQDSKALVAKAFDLLESRMAGKSGLGNILVPYRFIERESMDRPTRKVHES